MKKAGWSWKDGLAVGTVAAEVVGLLLMLYNHIQLNQLKTKMIIIAPLKDTHDLFIPFVVIYM